jgi:glycosyltransferase involved in cell wall biosynthesis
MTTDAPTVSVVMSVRDGARYLRAAVDSILAQTNRDFEFVVVDDG